MRVLVFERADRIFRTFCDLFSFSWTFCAVFWGKEVGLKSVSYSAS